MMESKRSPSGPVSQHDEDSLLWQEYWNGEDGVQAQKPRLTGDRETSYAGPCGDLNNALTAKSLTDARNARTQTRTIRNRSWMLFEMGHHDAAFDLLRHQIAKAETLSSQGVDLGIFLAYLYENVAWLTLKALKRRKTIYLDEGISALRQSIALSEKKYGIPQYDRFQCLLYLSSLVIQKYKIECTLSKPFQPALLEEASGYLISILDAYQGQCSAVAHLLQLNRARLLYCSCLYLTHPQSLRSHQLYKKVAVEALRDWLCFLHPRLKRNKLEHKLSPVYQNWQRLERSKVKKQLTFKAISNDASMEIIMQCKEFLYRGGKAYSKLGHHQISHYLLRLASGYFPRESQSLSRRLEFIMDMAEIEERENIFKAIDRLESLAPEFQEVRHGSHPVRLGAYHAFLGRLYEIAGLSDFAIRTGERGLEFATGKEQMKLEEMLDRCNPNAAPAVSPKSLGASLDDTIDDITCELKGENPRGLCKGLSDLLRQLSTIKVIHSDHKHKLRKMVVDIESFVDYWIGYSKIGELSNLELNWQRTSEAITDSLVSLRTGVATLMVNLCQIYFPQLTPRYMFYLGKIQEQGGDPSCLNTFYLAAFRASWLNDWKQFLKCFKEIIHLRSIIGVEHTTHDSYRLSRLLKCVIAIGEKTLEHVVFPYDRCRVIERFSPYIDFATFRLSELNVDKKGDWLFRGANALSSRSLTAIRVESPSGDQFENTEEQKLYREILIKEQEIASDPNADINDLNALRDAKYKLFIKIDRFGFAVCEPDGLRKVLENFLPKKICVASFQMDSSNSRLLVCGVANYLNDTWHRVVEIDWDLEELIYACWSDMTDQNDLSEAFEILIDPIREFVEDGDLLYIIPSDDLYRLPFHALYGDMKGKKQFLIQALEISYVQSPLLLWQLLRTDRRVSGDGLALGCLSPEVAWHDYSSDLSEWGMELAAPAQWNVNYLKQSYYTRPILYLTGHGYAPDEDQAMFEPFICLKDNEGHEIRLTAREFLEMGPKAHFVFLNSCWTGKGRSYGKDIYGFPYCIMGAANSSCLVSAVPVDAEFASSFGKRVLRRFYAGESDLSAVVAETVRESIESETWSFPYYWAPYFFYGDFRAPYCDLSPPGLTPPSSD